MNMDRDIVNRALFDVGQHPLYGEDGSEHNTTYELCKAFYISTFLEALSEVEWVGGRRWARLVRTGRPVIKDRRYRFAYDLPFDCARPIELQHNEYFMAEDRLILTDDRDAELLYVSNGKILRTIATAIAGEPGDMPAMEYLTAGQPDTEPEVTFWPGEPEHILDRLPEDPVLTDDYPDYRAPEYEPKFYEYIEKSLAAKFAIKLSEQPELHTLLLQEALFIKQEAVNASRTARAAKFNGSPWWTDQMGDDGRERRRVW